MRNLDADLDKSFDEALGSDVPESEPVQGWVTEAKIAVIRGGCSDSSVALVYIGDRNARWTWLR